MGGVVGTRRPANRNGCGGKPTNGNTSAGSERPRRPTRSSRSARCGSYATLPCHFGSVDHGGRSPRAMPRSTSSATAAATASSRRRAPTSQPNRPRSSITFGRTLKLKSTKPCLPCAFAFPRTAATCALLGSWFGCQLWSTRRCRWRPAPTGAPRREISADTGDDKNAMRARRSAAPGTNAHTRRRTLPLSSLRSCRASRGRR
jgi:hypothetical protein